jgi:hypothetical protein
MARMIAFLRDRLKGSLKRILKRDSNSRNRKMLKS